MKRIPNHGLAAMIVAALAASASPSVVVAQEPVHGEAAATAVPEDSWYGQTPPRVEKPSLAKQKAALRGQQRMARLDAMRWYGFSGGRPTAAAMPFTTMYSPAWQMPGGRPFAWYTTSRPVVIYAQPTAVYR